MSTGSQSTPKADRQATNASLPIMGPASQPIAYNFAPAPAGLSGAKLAAHNRAQRLAGILPAKPEKGAKATPLLPARGEGLELVLRIEPEDGGMEVRFTFMSGTEAAPFTAFPDHEAPLRDISAYAYRDDNGDLVPADNVRFSGSGSANTLAGVLPIMRKLDGALLGAYAETEDASFPQMVLTLASVLRVDRIDVLQPDGSVTSAKRGAAYITAFKAGEAHRKG